MVPSLGATSFLSVGPDSQGAPGDQPWPSISSVDPSEAVTGWSASQDLVLPSDAGPLDDFGVFWMDPSGPQEYAANLPGGEFPGGPLIAQLTVPTGSSWTMRLGVQGQATDVNQDDIQFPVVEWSP